MCEGTHPFIPIPKTAEVRMQFSTPGGVAENVFHVHDDDGWTGPKLEQVSDDFIDWWSTYYKTVVSGQVSLQRVVATDKNTEDSLQVTNTTGLPQAGTQGAAAVPDNVSLAIKLTTGFTGRTKRGRFFMVGIPSNFVALDKITSSTLDDIIAAMAQVLVVPSGTGQALGVASLCSDGEWRTEAQFTPYTNMEVDDTLDSQRRRLLGRGS